MLEIVALGEPSGQRICLDACRLSYGLNVNLPSVQQKMEAGENKAKIKTLFM